MESKTLTKARSGIPSPLQSAATIEILLGKGDGSFTVASTPATGNCPQDFVIADLNGDGMPDIATADLDGKTMTILLGNADGTFTFHSRIKLPGEPISIAVGDFNGDGSLDLATTDLADDGVMTLDVQLGDGNGNFSTKPSIVVPGPKTPFRKVVLPVHAKSCSC